MHRHFLRLHRRLYTFHLSIDYTFRTRLSLRTKSNDKIAATIECNVATCIWFGNSMNEWRALRGDPCVVTCLYTSSIVCANPVLRNNHAPSLLLFTFQMQLHSHSRRHSRLLTWQSSFFLYFILLRNYSLLTNYSAAAHIQNLTIFLSNNRDLASVSTGSFRILLTVGTPKMGLRFELCISTCMFPTQSNVNI